MNTRARIATLCQAQTYFSTPKENRKHIFALLDLALRQSPDLVCLPETFSTAGVARKSVFEVAEALDGPTLSAAAERARRHHAYIICPLFTRRGEQCFNSAAILDRQGEILGMYDKNHPVTSSPDYAVFEAGTTPGASSPVFDLDFGRIGIQICFDIQFPQGWADLAHQEARMVFWPSAYNGGFPLQAYAWQHHYYVISASAHTRSRMIDPCGTILEESGGLVNLLCRDINLDYAVCHSDFNYSIPDRILQAYPGRVLVRDHSDAGHFLVEPLDPTLTVARLQEEFGFETAAEYIRRHQSAYKRMAAGQEPLPQNARHGERAMYQK
ncbi:MAG: carbon-nitrogen hydrolase family protein [Anaerolineaceae bacterium]|nr:carbon-nitrogen hydrolase family protein [Anaerolineaceae bacterium]